MKKLLAFIGGFVLLILVAIIVIPLFINVDQYRPTIVSMANEKLNGKMELGKLSLSLWGQVKIKIAGLTIEDQKKNKVLAVEDAFFHLPFSSILGGEPALTLKMEKPFLYVHRNSAGELNLMKLAKEAPAGAEKPAASTSSPGKSGKSNMTLPAMVSSARLGVELRNTLVKIVDEKSELKNEIKDLNIVLKNISLTRTMEMDIWADLSTKMGSMLTVNGPFRLEGTFIPEMSGLDFNRMKSIMKLNLDQLDVSIPGIFMKAKGIPANVTLKFSATKKGAVIEDLAAQFHNALIQTKIAVSQNEKGDSSIKGSLQSNDIDLSKWNQLIPMMNDYELTGVMKLNSEFSGPAQALQYSGDFKIDHLTAKAPKIKGKPRLDFKMHFKTDQIDDILLTFAAPASDMKLTGKVLGFKKPQITMNLTSQKGLDLDQWVDLPPMKSSKSSEEAPPPPAAPVASTGTGEPDYDSMLDSMRTNDAVKAMTMQFNGKLPLMKVYDVKMTDIDTRFVMKDLVAAIETFKMKLWDGQISSKMRVDMKPKAPKYEMEASVQGLELKRSVESQFNMLKNTVLGRADFKMAGQGASFNKVAMLNNMKFNGNMKVANATFATIDVNRMVKEGLNGALEKIGDKVPQLKGKKINSLPEGQTVYEVISSDFSIAGGKFTAPNFVAKVRPNQGIDIEGFTQVGMIDYSIDAKWKLIDRYHLTGLYGIPANISGHTVEHVLAEGQSKPIEFPVSVGCTMTKPCYKYTQVAEHFISVATANITHAAEAKVKAEANKAAQEAARKAAEEAKKHLPPAANKQVDELKKRFGF